MKQALYLKCALLLAMGGCAVADEVVVPPYGQEIHIQFDEPVVSLSTVENGGRKHASAADKGLELFDVTGDASHPPIVQWTEQDRLSISFPEGVSCRTEYRLSFKPGSARYLSRREMPRRDFLFHCPPSRLSGQEVPGIPGGAVLVLPDTCTTAESLSFSTDSAVTYVFRRYDDAGGRRKVVEEVPGVARPAQLKHGLPRPVLQRLAASHTGDWSSIGPDSLLPGVALVCPRTPLAPREDWKLVCNDGGADGGKAEAAPAFQEEVLDVLFPQERLNSSVRQELEKDGRGMLMTVAFSAPIPAEAVPQLFRHMRLQAVETPGAAGAAAGAIAEVAEDGLSQSLVSGGKTYRFTLLPSPAPNPFDSRPVPLPEPRPAEAAETAAPAAETAAPAADAAPAGQGEESSPPQQRISYLPPGQVQRFSMLVEAPGPLTLDVSLPAGTRAVLGLEQEEEHTHRLSLNPAWPTLDEADDYLHGVCSLPLKGEHIVRLRTLNLESLTATLYHLPAAAAGRVAQENASFTVANKASAQWAEARYHAALLRAQRKLGLPVTDKELEQSEKALASRRAVAENLEFCISNLLAGAQASAPCAVPLSPPAALLHSEEVALDIDALAGGKAAPGLYVLRLQEVAAPQGKEGALPGGDWGQTAYYLLQVSDLNITISGSTALLTRLSDASAVEEGELLFFPEKDGPFASGQPQRVPVRQGLADARPLSPLGYVQVISGNDSLILLSSTSFPGTSEAGERRVSLVTDRDLYRPGETVHLRGVLRYVDAAGRASLPRTRESVSLSVKKPNGETLLSRRMSLDEYGAFDRDFTLPEGEEDVAGEYTIELKAWGTRYSHSIHCQIFRRDAFHAEMKLEMDRVAPEAWTLRVRAQDYNGSPLAGGKVSLRFRGTLPLQLAQAGQQGAGGNSGEREREQEVELCLGKDGEAALSGQVGALEEGEGSLSLTGSVANDREEYVVLPAVEAFCTAADFTIRVANDSLRLFPSSGKATDGNDPEEGMEGSQPLPRDQKVQVRLTSPVWVPSPLPGGFILWKEEDMVVWQQEVEVPAHCSAGVPLELASVWNEFKQSHPGTRQPMLHARGTDAAGRMVQLRQPYWPSSGYTEPMAEMELSYKAGDTPESAGALGAEATLPQGGQAYFLLSRPAGVRLLSRQVQAGRNSFTLPLEAGEEGTLSLSLLLPMQDADGAFRPWVCAQGQVEVPRRGAALAVALDVPETPLRPGTPLRLSGQVRQEGAAPAPHAAVTLYAVDAGMLSVSNYSCPDWLRLFTEKQPSAFLPPWNQRYRRDARPGHRHWAAQLTEPLWPGVRIRLDGSLIPDNYLYSLFWVDINPISAGVLYKGRSARRSFARNAAAGETSFDYAPPAVGGDMVAEAAPCIITEQGESAAATAPHLRTDFNPVAFWFPALTTDADGRFSMEATLPDTLTTYKVYALALGKDGSHFGKAEGSFTVNQPLMLTPGVPLFMSTGDTLRLPLTITNNTEQDGTWQVTFPGEAAPQRLQLRAHETATLYGDYTAAAEGDCTLGWSAAGTGDNSPQDAVEASFPVRFPAPLLKENHYLVLQPGQTPVDLNNLLAPELASSPRGKMEVALSANPLLHLQGCMDLLLSYPYGCTEQIAHGLLPWLLHGRLAPFNPAMAATSPEKARQTVAAGIGCLLARQQRDGGLSYWADGYESCFWASAQAALVLSLAREEGVPVPARKLEALRRYLMTTYRQLEKPQQLSPFTRYAIGRACGDASLAAAALADALKEESMKEEAKGQETRPQPANRWLRTRQSAASLRFLAALQKTDGTDGAEGTHAAFLEWLRVAAHDYRHSTTWDSGWMLLALHEYLLSLPPAGTPARVRLEDGTELSLGQGVTRLSLPDFSRPGSLQAVEGTAYATVKAKAQPERTDYPGITEKGLQVTRLYEKKGKDGIWRPATEFKAGDVVRITLTCAKAAPELEYFVLEDYLPSCMEAINPAVPSQSAGLEWQPWSPFVDHKEFLADRVRGFCTRWGGEGLLNMSYYARVKRAGTSTAPPAQAQLMYEPQIYGLSDNLKIQSQ